MEVFGIDIFSSSAVAWWQVAAALVQAVGSIVAIGAAIAIASHQSASDRHLAEDVRRFENAKPSRQTRAIMDALCTAIDLTLTLLERQKPLTYGQFHTYAESIVTDMTAYRTAILGIDVGSLRPPEVRMWVLITSQLSSLNPVKAMLPEVTIENMNALAPPDPTDYLEQKLRLLQKGARTLIERIDQPNSITRDFETL